MDQSRRAVESYWRTRMVDGVTADEDKVAPVYKLEEVCDLLRTSPAGIVKEVSDYILKRLDHKSPIVKQKALRLIKYAVGKSGNEFRREMQRHSTIMRQLVHYKGQLDTLKGDALNKAVRETAQETISAIFSTDDSKVVAPSHEGLGKRIQGFGNTNFEMVTEEKKSFLSEVIGLGSASIKQGLSTIASAHSSMKNDTGSYKSPTLRKSLTKETDRHHEYEGNDLHRETQFSSWTSKTVASGTWGPDSRSSSEATSNGIASSSNLGVKSREERLLETIVTSGGVRLQPTREALQTFLAEACKLDALSMNHALEMKLQSHLWQVRLKAICVLEAILWKREEEYFSVIASYFTENRDAVVRCTELPQVSLREKASKVLSLLSDEEITVVRNAGERSNMGSNVSPVLQVPDLIDTGDLEDDSHDRTKNSNDQSTINLDKPGSLVDDLFGQDSLADLNTNDIKVENDPFADVSFHNPVENNQNDLFSGSTVDNKPQNLQINEKNSTDLFDVFGRKSEQLLQEAVKSKMAVNDLMAGLTLNIADQNIQQPASAGASSGDFSGVTFLNDNTQLSHIPTNGVLNGNLGLSDLYNQAPMQYNLPPNMIFNQRFPAQPMHYGSNGYVIAQQQLLSQNMGNLNPVYGHRAGNVAEGNQTSLFPDIFQISGNPVQGHASIANSPLKETKAFDFISDHLAAARDPRRVL